MIKLPYPRKPLPEYTTRPSAAARTGSPSAPPISTPLFLTSSKRLMMGPRAGQISDRPSTALGIDEPDIAGVGGIDARGAGVVVSGAAGGKLPSGTLDCGLLPPSGAD